jgi:hypothetical protein
LTAGLTPVTVDVEGIAGLQLSDVGKEPAFGEAIAVEGEAPESGEDEVIAGIEVGEAVVRFGVEVLLQGITALGAEGVEVHRLTPGVGGVELEAMGHGFADGDQRAL